MQSSSRRGRTFIKQIILFAISWTVRNNFNPPVHILERLLGQLHRWRALLPGEGSCWVRWLATGSLSLLFA